MAVIAIWSKWWCLNCEMLNFGDFDLWNAATSGEGGREKEKNSSEQEGGRRHPWKKKRWKGKKWKREEQRAGRLTTSLKRETVKREKWNMSRKVNDILEKQKDEKRNDEKRKASRKVVVNILEKRKVTLMKSGPTLWDYFLLVLFQVTCCYLFVLRGWEAD